jgi:hypothetical protein
MTQKGYSRTDGVETMTNCEIYRTIRQHISHELLDKYEHLCYGEMAEVPELAPRAGDLRWAEEEWTKVDLQETVFS